MSTRLNLLVLLVFPAACGDGATEPLSYESIAGQYGAEMDAISLGSSGVALDAHF